MMRVLHLQPEVQDSLGVFPQRNNFSIISQYVCHVVSVLFAEITLFERTSCGR